MKKLIFKLFLVSGLASAYAATNPKFDLSIRPQDDFYSYVNGTWLKNTTIPEDKASWGAFNEIHENTIEQLHQIINSLATDKNTENKQKIYTLYTNYMNEAKLEALGIAPLNGQIAEIDNITDKKQIPELIANLNQIDVNTPMYINIHQDARDSSIVIADIVQNGLGLPDRDYYLKANDKNLSLIKQKYSDHIRMMLSQSGDTNAAQDARNIVGLETKLAKIQWTNVQNRDPVKTYNKIVLDKLPALMPNFNWEGYLNSARLNKKISYLVVSQPSYLKGLDNILQQTPLSVWKAYFKWHLLSAYSPLLSKAYDDAHFAFYSTVLNGIPKQKPRYKRAIDQIEESLGEALGELYVAKYFPPENKEKMGKLVDNLILTYRNSINSLDWMSEATKAKAQNKLNKLMLKIAYPDKWRDYSKLEIKPDDLVGNVMRASQFEYNRQIDKLGKPVDKTQWQMTPQTINAYYNPELNEIVFPAAILQPPFFDVKADDAFNYGGIGAVIGHEISHAFDDQGSQYDENGNLHNWWTKTDKEKFASKTKALVKQYAAYSPLSGYHINGELTLGENIADNSGLAIAYKAYHLSLGDNKAPVIDNFTGDQRLYLGWAEVWRNKMRDPLMIQMIKTNPHSPAQFRANGTVKNQPGFYDAFDVKPGDKMYLSPEKRVIIW
ncbi:MAG: Peptidase [Burkholderiales bacterium]|jgi:predicted metalloendopeptidase|nr:Peptidase [Burkholderiales bacterium]